MFRDRVENFFPAGKRENLAEGLCLEPILFVCGYQYGGRMHERCGMVDGIKEMMAEGNGKLSGLEVDSYSRCRGMVKGKKSPHQPFGTIGYQSCQDGGHLSLPYGWFEEFDEVISVRL